MEYGTKIRTVPPSNTSKSSNSLASSITPPNPYARDPSRRAIACVTCAKAKTRCDKTLPSCSRCIAKGIKCDPRSTRRTSENTYRSLPTKKPFVTPKRFNPPGILPSSSLTPARSTPSTRPRSIMRAPSHIDFRTAVKMSQQAAIISGVSKLTPLPTYQSQIADACYEATPTPEPELRYTPEIEQDTFLLSRGGTPQTPDEPFGCHQVLDVVDDMYLDCPTWSGDGLVPIGLGFGLNMDSEWMTPTPEPEEMGIGGVFGQPGSAGFASIPDLPVQTLGDVSTTDWSFDLPQQNIMDTKDGGLDSGIVMQGEWTTQQQQYSGGKDSFIDMGMVTSAPYVPKMRGLPGAAPMWEDVFMPGALAY